MIDLPENQIVALAQSGNRRAEKIILEKYERLVHKLAWKYAFMVPSYTHEDFVQEGNIGLVNAIRSFNDDRGAKFMTWAYYHIRGALTSCGKSDKRQPKYPLTLEDCPRAYNFEDPTQDIEVKDDLPENLAMMLISSCCGGFNTKRAKVVIDRFGLFGNKELRNCETAEKYGITKYAVNTHVYAFKKKAAQKFAHLKEFV
jgi:RNA polymerase sigma factor (sigma-70 family)